MNPMTAATQNQPLDAEALTVSNCVPARLDDETAPHRLDETALLVTNCVPAHAA
ncbi:MULTISPECIES: hypothetical protein [unclassified Streptomyces]|uniref:hypothetical protein n=1 Tax=unclassified Streptomyces TaxID=2593676 RepID=UPI000A5FCAB1|nr:hypothetical protein [Streptomyces sp. NRRL F-5727]